MKLRTDTADGPNRRFSRGLAVLRRRAGLTQKAVSIAVWGVESMGVEAGWTALPDASAPSATPSSHSAPRSSATSSENS